MPAKVNVTSMEIEGIEIAITRNAVITDGDLGQSYSISNK